MEFPIFSGETEDIKSLCFLFFEWVKKVVTRQASEKVAWAKTKSPHARRVGTRSYPSEADISYAMSPRLRERDVWTPC
jgi:hypothetical protein